MPIGLQLAAAECGEIGAAVDYHENADGGYYEDEDNKAHVCLLEALQFENTRETAAEDEQCKHYRDGRKDLLNALFGCQGLPLKW